MTLGNVDWALTKDIVAIFGTLGALAIGAIGLNTWRRQLEGTAEHEVARRALLLTYQVREEIQAVRSPMLHMPKEDVEAGSRLKEEQRIYCERMSRLGEKWIQLRVLALEARVIWGEEAERRFNLLEELIRTLRAQVWLHFWLKGAYAGPGVAVDNNPERVAANEKVLYYVSDNDEFSLRVNNAVEHVKEFFQPRIRRQGILSAWRRSVSRFAKL